MQYCILLVSGLVITILGPFKTRGEAKKWGDAQATKLWTIIPILAPGEVDGDLGSS